MKRSAAVKIALLTERVSMTEAATARVSVTGAACDRLLEQGLHSVAARACQRGPADLNNAIHAPISYKQCKSPENHRGRDHGECQRIMPGVEDSKEPTSSVRCTAKPTTTVRQKNGPNRKG